MLVTQNSKGALVVFLSFHFLTRQRVTRVPSVFINPNEVPSQKAHPGARHLRPAPAGHVAAHRGAAAAAQHAAAGGHDAGAVALRPGGGRRCGLVAGVAWWLVVSGLGLGSGDGAGVRMVCVCSDTACSICLSDKLCTGHYFQNFR